ncbi:cysteine desulfurase IscS [Oleiphilus sp. HI0071]|nr:aminotransferase class V-fold PLP-dependent enzyme [Oleiphilus sp. HI0080]KZY74869.1 cysteine desulfurase IscS [Oleiphilus sp. HI0065]KZY82049.1 cysteine desulfurase IscS [Oleiphilus sp. HI0071]KZY91178.1 cysteine desulfurase IscS [Oleiphilus sp. HI0073]KZZ42201.1 cysteine desulfurase IscS [Oleiphilus sp. HI0118]KZZ60353.1 cysteine desulfurase IscS [Oleiphilus sp. HI0122]KZZ71587.1 cysteine desulfurase IscS [Oleiphilus sp. HI0130]KZZ82006.1 cysteine desulfurase IscS [Oleiphilus sp. HI0133
MIYLDYAATTPADPRVVEKMLAYLGVGTCFANPASRSHMLGWQAEAAVEAARKTIAKSLHCDVRELVWTSGATESNNLAIKGALEYLRGKGDERRHIITSKTEHKAVLDVFEYLAGLGYQTTFIDPDEDGVISVERLAAAIQPDTALVSAMHVNNETGVVNPIMELAQFTKSHGALFHADCAQSAGKLRINLSELPADMISLCAHKIYGPKGVGALFVRRSTEFGVREQIHGGGHERGMRSGTLPVHQIVGFAEALQLCTEDMQAEQERVAGYRARFLQMLGGATYRINGNPEKTVPGIVNLSFPGVDGQMLLTALPNLGVSSGSACNSASMKPSHVLKAMGLGDEEALSSLRFSFGRFTTDDEVLDAASQLRNALSKLAQ